MNLQEKYRKIYKEINPSWSDCLTLYQETINSWVSEDTIILDIGCGHGDFMRKVYEKTSNTYGVDPDKRALDKNQIIKNKVEGSVYFLPFPKNYFDLVVSAFVLEHLEDPNKAFEEIYRVLKPGGKVVFLTPNIWNYNVWIIRVIPQIFHDFLTKLLYHRQENDTFKKFYKVNSIERVNSILLPIGFKKEKMIINGDPTYLAFNDLLFKISVFVENKLDRWLPDLKVHLIGVYKK